MPLHRKELWRTARWLKAWSEILMSETALQRGPSPDPLRRGRLPRSNLQVCTALCAALGADIVSMCRTGRDPFITRKSASGRPGCRHCLKRLCKDLHWSS